ncbi:MAG: lysophospholipase [Woeseia sp.]
MQTADVRYLEDELAGTGGMLLFSRQWLPAASPPRLILVIAHGFSEHSGRYDWHARQLAASGVATFSWDHRGHGRSPGQRGHIDAMSDYRGDVAAQIARARGAYGNVPLFLLGHSMGSLIVLDYALRHPEALRGVATSGAGLEPAGIAKPLVVATARFFSRIWPRFPLKMQVDAEDLSTLPEEVAAYNNDPLVHKFGSARWGCELLDAIAWIKAHAGDLQVPLLMLHGADDRINLPRGSEEFVAAVGSADATLKRYPGCLHEVHNDAARDEWLHDLQAWMLSNSV